MESSTPTPVSDQHLNDIFVALFSRCTFPLKSSQLVTSYASACFKVRQALPNTEHDQLFELIKRMNYQAATDKARDMRTTILELSRDRLVESLSIESSLKMLNTKLLDQLVSQEFIQGLPSLFDFTLNLPDVNRKVAKCFDDLQMLMLKLTEFVLDHFEMREEFKHGLEQEIEKIRKELIIFCEQHFYYFQVELEKEIREVARTVPFEGPKEPKMQRIQSSIRRYREKVTRKVGVSEWLLPKKVVKDRLTSNDPLIRNEIAKAVHNKADFSLKVKPKLYLLLGKNGNLCRFDFLKPDDRTVLVSVIVETFQKFSSTKKGKESVSRTLNTLADYGLNVNLGSLSLGVQPNFSEEYNLLIMINFYLLFRWNYDCVVRNFLKVLFRQFSNFEFGYSNFKMLLALENMRFDESTSRLSMNPTASRVYEHETFPIKQMASLTLQRKSSDSTTNQTVPFNKRTSLSEFNSENRTILDLLRSEETALANKEIILMMTRLNLHSLKEKQSKLPLLEFEKISNPKLSSRVVTVCVSGFTSQNEMKEESWRNLVDEHDGEVYALNWQSRTSKDMYKFMWSKLEKIVVNRIFSSIPILNAVNILTTLIDAYKTNPFFAAFDEAQLAGLFLGYLLPEIFPDQLVNLVGFSLGTELIKECIKVMKSNEQCTMLNKVVLIGGVADRQQLKTVLSDIPFEVCNFHSDNDHILKILYRLCKPLNEACGLGPIELPVVENVDCSEFVEGHTKYRGQFEQIKRRLELDDDTFYYYKEQE